MIELSFVSELENPNALKALLYEYYCALTPVAEEAGFPEYSPDEVASEFMLHSDEVLPPNGRLLLASDSNGRIVGCGMLRFIRPDAVELKRVFVRPEAQRQKLGRKLVEALLAEARKTGCSALYADTIKGNTAMTNLCESLGFTYIDRYPENAHPPEYEAYIVYMRYQFT